MTPTDGSAGIDTGADADAGIDAAYAIAAALMGPFAARAQAPEPDAAFGGALLCDEDWLAERVSDTHRRWGCADDRVAGTLWWYSASATLTAPAPAMLLTTGQAPDPAPETLTCTLTPDGYLAAARSSRFVGGAEEYAAALGPALERIIRPLAAVSGAAERALWAIASDSLAGRTLTAEATDGSGTPGGTAGTPGVAAAGAEGHASGLARVLTLSPLVPPRFTEVDGTPLVRRCSCCLIYRTGSGGAKCASCPRRRPEQRIAAQRDRLRRLRADGPS